MKNDRKSDRSNDKKSDRRLVYSTDPKDRVESSKSRTAVSHSQVFDISKCVVVFRLEKNGRGGKTVTILSALPKNDEFLNALTKELKSKCGTGGTYKVLDTFAEIEIQGDKRDALKKILTLKGIKFKGM